MGFSGFTLGPLVQCCKNIPHLFCNAGTAFFWGGKLTDLMLIPVNDDKKGIFDLG